MSLNPWTHIEMPSLVTCVIGKQDQENTWSSLTSQSTLIGEPQDRRGSALKGVESTLEDDAESFNSIAYTPTEI